jgi:hypothetical protein
MFCTAVGRAGSKTQACDTVSPPIFEVLMQLGSRLETTPRMFQNRIMIA